MKINSKFKKLIPPLSVDEYEMLKESIKAEGVRDALIVWGDTLIDGHNRYEICSELDIPYETRQIEFADEEDAEMWILRNQLSRRNLCDVERARIALRLKDKIAEKAKERQSQAGKDKLPQNFGEAINRKERETMKVLAKEAGMSHETLRKVEKVDTTAPEPVKEAMGNIISIDKAYQIARELRKTPEEQREAKAQEMITESYNRQRKELAKRERIAASLEKMAYSAALDGSSITQENVDIMLEERATSMTCGEWIETIEASIEALNKMKGFIQNRNCIRRIK